MSTQPPSFPPITLSINPTFQTIRLLELPDELLNIIEDSTGQETIYFKSSPATSTADNNNSSSSSGGNDEKEGHLHVCTDTKTWLVKQVSTSNSLYVTGVASGVTKTVDGDEAEDRDVMDLDGGDADTDGVSSAGIGVDGGGITAFAKPEHVLELHPVSAVDCERVVAEGLGRLVPVLDEVGDVMVTESLYSIAQLYQHIPAPRVAIAKGLAQRCVFERPWSKGGASAAGAGAGGLGPTSTSASEEDWYRAYEPSPRLLLETWKKLLDATVIAGRKITSDLAADLLSEEVMESERSWHDDMDHVYKAILQRLFGKDGHLQVIGVITSSGQTGEQDHLDEMETARWIGNLILKVKGDLSKDIFEKDWEDCVPAAWVKYCSVEVLGRACTVEKRNEQEFVLWKAFAVEKSTTGTASSQASMQKTDTAPAASNTKRKWHEKFAAQRNLKR